MFGLERRIGLV